MRSTSTPAPPQAVLWMAILAAALAAFTVARQTLHRPGTPFGDFAHLALGADCLVERCNPYDSAALNSLAATLHQGEPPVWPQAPVYPPSALLIALPFARLGWPAAPVLFDLLGGVLYGLAAILLIWRLHLGWVVTALPLLATLVAYPLAATLEFANPSLLASALAGIAALLLLEHARRRAALELLAWLLLAFALALKPQLIAGVFIPLLCIRDTRFPALKAAAGSIALLLIACTAYRLRLGSFAFLTQLRANLHMAMLPGSTSDFSPANAESFDFLNLQTVLSRLPHLGRAAAELLAWAATLLLAASTTWAARRRHSLQHQPWTILALAVLISLMPLYHRGYDRVIALLLVPAAVEIARRSRRLAWLYSTVLCLWIANDTLFQHLLRRWRYKPQNPLEELLLCAMLLASVWRSTPVHSSTTPLRVGSIAG